MEEKKKSKECPKNSILDYNLSWGLMLVYLGYLLGIWFAQQTTKDYVISRFSGAPYFLVSIICGVVVTFLVYNLGKLIAAKLSGYEVIYVKMLGFIFDKSSGKTKVRYDILSFFDISMQFAPKNDDINKKPTMIFFGGLIAEFVLIAVCLAIFFVFGISGRKDTMSTLAWTMLFGMSYGFLTPLYEILPFRQDVPTDVFNMLVTRKPEDKIAFNVVQINKRRELNNEDYLVYEMEDYESFYRSRVLYGNYLDNLYASRLEKAFTVLEKMRYYSKYYNDLDRHIPAGETIYLRYLIDDDNGADQQYLALKKDDKRSVVAPERLSEYRTALLVAGLIAGDSEKVKELRNKFNKLVESDNEPSKRVKKEKEFFDKAYEKVRTKRPEFNLPE